MKVIVYKHHIKEHFDKDGSLYEKDNGPGAGATVFLTYKAMRDYLKKTDVEWCWCRSEVDEEHLIKELDDMATITETYESIEGWKVFDKI